MSKKGKKNDLGDIRLPSHDGDLDINNDGVNDFSDYNNNGVKDHKEPQEKKRSYPNKEEGAFSFGDYMRFIWLYLLKEGEGLLTEQREAARKVISWGTVAFVMGSILLLALISWVF